MSYITIERARFLVDYQVDGIGRSYFIFSEMTYDNSHDKWMDDKDILDYIAARLVAKGGASLAALACSLVPVDFQLEDWISEETWLQVNAKAVREISLAYEDQIRTKVIDSVCDWVIDRISDPDWWRTPWRVQEMRDTYYESPEDWWIIEGGHLLNKKQYQNCFKVAFATYLQTMPAMKRAWVKANLPIEFIL